MVCHTDPLLEPLQIALVFLEITLDHVGRIASLIERSKLATLGTRAANPRVQKAIYWLAWVGEAEKT